MSVKHENAELRARFNEMSESHLNFIKAKRNRNQAFNGIRNVATLSLL